MFLISRRRSRDDVGVRIFVRADSVAARSFVSIPVICYQYQFER